MMHMIPITRHEHYLEMRGFMNDLAGSDNRGRPHFTAIECLWIAYGPGHASRRRRWERTTRTIAWDVSSGFEISIEARRDAVADQVSP